MAQPIAAQAIVNAQNQVELGKIPLWYGDKKKDAFTAEHYIERIELSRQAAPWTGPQTLNYFYQALRGPAVIWWATLTDDGIDMTDWPTIRTRFLRTYASAVTERSAVANLRIQQGATESVQDYAGRITMALREHKATSCPRPAIANADLAVNMFGGPFPAETWHANCPDDRKRAIMDYVRERADAYNRDCMARNVFISGLRPNIREKMMTRDRPEPYLETKEIAMNLERQLTDPSKAEHVTELELEELKETAAIRRGKPNKFVPKTSDKRTSVERKTNFKCWYCGIPGHTQPNCYKRKRENGQYKDKDGKPYQRKVAEIDQNERNQTCSDQSYEELMQTHAATTEKLLNSINFDYLNFK